MDLSWNITSGRIEHLGSWTNAVGTAWDRPHRIGSSLAEAVEVIDVISIECSVAPRIENVLAVAVEGQVELEKEKTKN